jgi:hypothetical protein
VQTVRPRRRVPVRHRFRDRARTPRPRPRGHRGLVGRTTAVEYQGNDDFVHLDTPAGELVVRDTSHTTVEYGARVGVGVDFDVADAYLFDPSTGDGLETRDEARWRPELAAD